MVGWMVETTAVNWVDETAELWVCMKVERLSVQLADRMVVCWAEVKGQLRADWRVGKLVDLMGIQMVATLGLNWLVRKVVKTADGRVELTV